MTALDRLAQKPLPRDQEAVQTLVERLQRELRERLGELVPSGTPVAHLDFPNHDNVGDTAIWLGERALLSDLGLEVAYTASFSSYSASMVRRAVGKSGVILLHGGGNLGDLWPTYQAFRERVIRSHPETRIVQLPQTINFENAVSTRRAAEVFSSHPDLTIMARDRASENFARETFDSSRVVVAPDMAFALGVQPATRPTSGVLLIVRTDHERRDGLAADLPEGVRHDWPVRIGGGRLRRWYKVSRALGFAAKRSPLAAHLVDAPLLGTFDRLASERLATGMAMVESSSVLVTDRLHGHILALLHGRPQILLEDRYGKVRSFWERWTADSPITEWATELGPALDRARSIESECV